MDVLHDTALYTDRHGFTDVGQLSYTYNPTPSVPSVVDLLYTVVAEIRNKSNRRRLE